MTALGKPVPARRIISICGLLIVALAVALGASAARSNGSPAGRLARVVRLEEHGRLKIYSERGATLIERGTAYGTYTATMVADLTIRSKSVTAVVTIYPRGGSITGSASATYRIVRNLGYFGGTLNLDHGAGRYSHVAEVNHKPLGISGIINRYTLEVEVKASGEVTGL